MAGPMVILAKNSRWTNVVPNLANLGGPGMDSSTNDKLGIGKKIHISFAHDIMMLSFLFLNSSKYKPATAD
jgi:hypothetical protein